MNPGIAFFDFDGTVTYKDSLLEFIKYSKGSLRFSLGFLMNTHYLFLYKLKIISNQKAKEKVLSSFFGGVDAFTFQEQCIRFAADVIPLLIRPAALSEILKLQEQGIRIVIVSASPGEWIEPWAKSLNVEVVATRLQYSNNTFTGKIEGLNCYGQEKVRRIHEEYNLTDYETIYAYGDSTGDKPMLSLANKGFMKPFRD
jgi:HAD superfamily hydrolase (TIGR01490 family)